MVPVIQGLTSGLDNTSVRNILVSFGFITFYGKLPRELLDMFFFYKYFFLIWNLTLILTRNRLKLEVNPYVEGCTLFRRISSDKTLLMDLPCFVHFFSSWLTAGGWSTFTIFASMDTAFSGFKF